MKSLHEHSFTMDTEHSRAGRKQKAHCLSPVGTPDRLQGVKECLQFLSGGVLTPPLNSLLIRTPEPWEEPREKQTSRKWSLQREAGATWGKPLDWQTLPTALLTPNTIKREKSKSMQSKLIQTIKTPFVQFKGAAHKNYPVMIMILWHYIL